jgi:V/A-type H+/Na+-transporting ATPase subunit D
MPNIAPTKLNLINTKEFLSLARDGKNLLEEKKEVLLANILTVLKELKQVRAEFDELVKEIYQDFLYIKLFLGEDIILNELKSANVKEIEFDILPKNIIGVVVPTIKNLKVDVKANIDPSVFFSSYKMNELMLKFEKFVKKMVEVIEKEAIMWNLIKDLKKTQRRVNSLDNIIIPGLLEDIKFIVDSLEDRDREVIFQLQRMKSKKSKR